MALCVTVDGAGVMTVQTGVPAASCTGYLLVEPSEYQQIITANNLYALPASQDFAAAWSAGFVLPLTVYMAAWGVATLVNFFKH